MEPILAYAAGLLTLINPCVLPVLPVVLAASLQSARHGPAAMAAGMGASFILFGFVVAVFGRAIGLTPEGLTQIGAALMIGFGAVLLIPPLSAGFATATAGMAARADAAADGSGLGGQFAGGALLGAVWSPCIGPTLGGAIALASTGGSPGRVLVIMSAFALGVATIVLALGYGARAAILRRRDAMRRLSSAARPIMGGVFLLVGVALLMRWNHAIDAWLLDRLPHWLTDLSVAL
nr:cytochrome c biogenesis CcdA family protein [Hasllibacter halocynthiae]